MRHEATWQRDLRRSSKAFLDHVWPVIGTGLGGGDVIPIESVTNSEMASKLDQLGGCDVWQVVGDSGMRGIGSRVQHATPYASFTIRKTRTSGAETEWAKRHRALKSPAGWLYPALVIQAYVADFDRGPLLYACAVRTRDLFSLAQEALCGSAWERRVNGSDGNEFAVFWTDWLRHQGIKVFEYTAPGIAPRGPRRFAREATR